MQVSQQEGTGWRKGEHPTCKNDAMGTRVQIELRVLEVLALQVVVAQMHHVIIPFLVQVLRRWRPPRQELVADCLSATQRRGKDRMWK
eukprot:6129406-Pleurochrysis_carterae.AAC.1